MVVEARIEGSNGTPPAILATVPPGETKTMDLTLLRPWDVGSHYELTTEVSVTCFPDDSGGVAEIKDQHMEGGVQTLPIDPIVTHPVMHNGEEGTLVFQHIPGEIPA